MDFPFWLRGPVRLHLLADDEASRLALPITQRSAAGPRAATMAR